MILLPLLLLLFHSLRLLLWLLLRCGIDGFVLFIVVCCWNAIVVAAVVAVDDMNLLLLLILLLLLTLTVLSGVV